MLVQFYLCIRSVKKTFKAQFLDVFQMHVCIFLHLYSQVSIYTIKTEQHHLCFCWHLRLFLVTFYSNCNGSLAFHAPLSLAGDLQESIELLKDFIPHLRHDL